MIRLSLTTLVALVLALLAGCAVLDPNNIVGRRNPGTANDNTFLPSSEGDWRKSAFEYVWITVNEKYYDPALNGVDWQAARMRHQDRILNVADAATTQRRGHAMTGSGLAI